MRRLSRSDFDMRGLLRFYFVKILSASFRSMTPHYTRDVYRPMIWPVSQMSVFRRGSAPIPPQAVPPIAQSGPWGLPEE